MTTLATSFASSDAAPDLDTLRSRLAGDILTAAHDDYETARQLHNINIDRRPALIVRPAQTSDVAEAVRFARANDLAIAVRSGGHSLAGHSVVEGGLVIDFRHMKHVAIDSEQRTARVQPGVTSSDLAGPAHAYGLALTTGDTANVGLGGLVTGGGIGWFARKHGLTIDNLLSIEMVTADGEVLRASKTENEDLFWAVRGGGGNFGIVTEFEFQLIQAGSVVGGMLVLPATPEAVRGYLDYAPVAPDGLTTIASLMLAPPAPFIPADKVGTPIFAITVCYLGTDEGANVALEPLRRLGQPVADVISRMPYPVMFTLNAPANLPHGCSLRSMFADEISDDMVRAAVEASAHPSSPMNQIQFRGLGGAISRVDPSATAFAHRERRIMYTSLALWDDATTDPAPHEAWTEALWATVRPAAKGVYANFLGDEGDERIAEAYPEATYVRLAEAKRTYDPQNVFSLNQNIRPAR